MKRTGNAVNWTRRSLIEIFQQEPTLGWSAFDTRDFIKPSVLSLFQKFIAMPFVIFVAFLFRSFAQCPHSQAVTNAADHPKYCCICFS